MTNCSLTIWLRLDSDREILPLESAPQTTGNESFSRMLFFHQQIWIQMYSNLCPVNQVHECLCVCRKCCILCFVWSSKSAVRATYGWADNKRTTLPQMVTVTTTNRRNDSGTLGNAVKTSSALKKHHDLRATMCNVDKISWLCFYLEFLQQTSSSLTLSSWIWLCPLLNQL